MHYAIHYKANRNPTMVRRQAMSSKFPNDSLKVLKVIKRQV